MNLLWITYKRSFAPLLIEKNKVAKLTSDSGWGCVIRCTQMLLANCLQKMLFNESGHDDGILTEHIVK